MALQRHNRTRQRAAKASIAAVLRGIEGGFECLELAELDWPLIARLGHGTAEQPERDFGR